MGRITMARIYLDSCMVIGLIEGTQLQRRILKNQLPVHFVYSSELVRLESRVLPLRNNDQESLLKYEHFFNACNMVAFDKSVFERATILRSKSRMRTPDALHLAAAIHAGCEELWTNDKEFIALAKGHLTVLDWEKLESNG